jgi:hypothetical protein
MAGVGRPRKIVEEIDLYRWVQKNINTDTMETGAMQLPHDCHKYLERRATVWGLHQFDPVVLAEALKGEAPSRGRMFHQPKSWDLYRIVRTYIAVVELGTEKLERGRTKIEPNRLNSIRDKEAAKEWENDAPQLKRSVLTALEKLREFHVILASLHPEFLQTLAGQERAEEPSTELPAAKDSIVLRMTRDEPVKKRGRPKKAAS